MTQLVIEDPGAPVEAELISQLRPHVPLRRCEVGEKLITTGEQADCFYYVEQGLFEVSYMARKTPIVVALIGQGEFFGEIGFFDGMTRTRNIQAREPAQLRVFDRVVMARLLAAAPQLYARFLEFLMRSACGRFRQILTDRGPLTAYAAALATGREQFQGLQALPPDLLGSAAWQMISGQIEGFKAGMFDVADRLQREVGPHIPPELQARGDAILDDFTEKVRRFGASIQETPGADLLWGYIFKEVFPYLMRSRFAERAYYKPKGFAGDFWMIELIYRNEPEGDGKMGKLIDGWALRQVPPRAVRARRDLLRGLLDRLCRARLSTGGPLRIMNLACGPTRELFDLLPEVDYAARIDALCIDIDAEALEFASEQRNRAVSAASVRFMNENVIKWALGRVKHDFGAQDIIYSSGLCDYLDDRIIAAMLKRCYGQLKPGGALVIGNFSPANPDRYFMDHLLYWRLIHRDRDELRRLFAASPFGESVEIVAETEGVNLFAIARRPD
jgi:extracellular factor (EF) 3-hydroxypalmitic acid methyl ester biosynthesis protein